MRRTTLFALMMTLGLAAAVPAGAEEAVPTFTKDVAPIFYEHCVACHRTGEFAPMPLMTYDDARPWARSVKQRVEGREMPPWYAEPGHQTYANDASLSTEEIATIAAWVDGGAPEGDAEDLPPAPQFPSGWTIGEPDVVLSMLAPYDLPANGTVPYLYFTVPTNFTEDKWIRAVEIRPGDRRVVHHVIATLQRPDPDSPPSPEPSLARERGRQVGSLGGTVPNKLGVTYPEGVARRIAAGAEVVLQMHYTTMGEATTDRTRIGLIFADEPPARVVGGGALINPFFVIPPGAEDHVVRAERTLTADTWLTTMTPHMHSRGKSFSYTAVYPDGTEEILLNVPSYNFDWQLTYELAEPKLLPAGTRLVGEAHYDNSVNNRVNPDPTTEVRWGDQTWEEMMIGFYGTEMLEVPAGQDADLGARIAQLRERLQETYARLNLTDEQIEQVGPILRAAFAAQVEVLQEHGIDLLGDDSGAAGRLGLLQLRRLRRDLEAVREQTIEALDAVLTAEQLDTYKAIQEENGQAMRERLRRRR